MSGFNIADQLKNQIGPAIESAVNNRIADIVTVVQARWEDRVNRRISEAEWAVKQNRIYDPNHALLKTYDAYKWVGDHVHLGVDILRTETGATISMKAESNDDSAIDDFRQERIGEVLGDLMKQINYSYF